MVFSSLLFLFRFLPIVLVVYYAAPRKLRNLVLFLSSLIFYAWGEPVYVVLILFSAIVDYTAGRIVGYCRNIHRDKTALAAVIFSAVVNVGLLGFFKYGDFILQNIGKISGYHIPHMNIALPIGISFYTFQTMSYTIDVYRGETNVQKNFISFGAYVALFPQLIAGPIIRYKTVAEQLTNRRETLDSFYRGIVRFVAGLGKKVLIANYVGAMWNEIAHMETGDLTISMAWLGILAFTLQIYYDFSGYSDMAIGLGLMFGFNFPENFNYPYESKSITEFWRRWHISLGTWFKEYVYIPLGGNKKGIARQMFNIAIVWLLTGLWHGAYWNFVLWGIYYGILLVVEKLIWKRIIVHIPALLCHMYTMAAVMIGWSLFAWQDMKYGVEYIKTMFFMNSAELINRHTLFVFSENMLILLIACLGSVSLIKKCFDKKCFPEGTVRRDTVMIVYMCVILFTCVAVLVNSSYNPFLYFRF